MKRNIIAVLAIVMVLCCLTLAACNDDAGKVLDSYIFEMDGTTVAEDFTLPTTIGGEAAEWKSDNAAVQLQKRESDWLATVSLPETGSVDVNLTVTVKKASKTYTVRVKALDVYDFMDKYSFPKNKATIVDNFDLETSFEYKGKTATIAWSVEQDYELYIKVINEGKTLQVTPQGKQTPVQIKATFTYGGVSESQSYRMTVYKTMEKLELVNYWYTNTGVSVKLSGYVVEIARAYSDGYKNMSFYIVNDDFSAGYYIYNVKSTAEQAATVKKGVHVTVTGAANTNYNGLIETNGGGTFVVDAEKELINVDEKVKAIDEEIIGALPSTIYHESRLVSLSNWKVKSVATPNVDSKKYVVLTLEKGKKTVDVVVSKYLEGAYTAKTGDATFDALCALGTTYPVGSMINVTGVFSNFSGTWQIMPLNAAAVTASGKEADAETTEYAGQKVAKAMAHVTDKLLEDGIYEFNKETKKNDIKRITTEKEFTLDTTIDGVTVEYEVVGKSNAVVIKDGKMTVKPDNPETTTIQATYTSGEFTSEAFFFVESLIPTAASMVEDLDVPEKIKVVTELPTAPEGATIEWKVVSGSESIEIKNGQLIPTLKEKDAATIINATLTYKEVTRSKDFVVIVKAGKGSVEVKAPFEAGKGYVLTVDQTNLAKQIYAKNEMSTYYIASVDNTDDIQPVYVEIVEGGYKLYFKKVNSDKTETKTYIAYKADGDHTNILLDPTGEETNVWKWNAENECFTCNLTSNKGTFDYYLGANYTNQTFRLNQVKEDKPFFNENNFRAYLGEVKFVPLTEYNIKVDAEASEKATIKLDDTKGVNGQKFTFKVEPKEGVELESVKVNGETVEAVDGVYTGTVLGETTVTVVEKVDNTFIKLALKAAEALENNKTTAESYILIGTVSRIDTAYNAQFKNVSFYLNDGVCEVLVYRYNLDDASTIKVGDKLAIAAPMKKFGTTLEAVGTFVKLNVTDLATAAEAGLAGTGAAGTMVYGKIKSIDTAYSSDHNNITITITDGTNDLNCYRVKGGADLKVGDYVLVTGKPASYKNKAQMGAGATYVVNGIYTAPTAA